MIDFTKYGDRYWCVRTETETVMCHANRVVIQDGCLTLMGSYKREENEKNTGGEEIVLLSFSAGNWISVWAASVLDGFPVAVEYWKTPTTSENIIGE